MAPAPAVTRLPRPAGHRLAWAAAGLVVLLPALAWCSGFGWFLYAATHVVPPPERADGIVALTGGAVRVETALRLLAEGRAPVLLLSGIGGGAELPELAARAGLDPAPLEARVTLGRMAETTLGNAAETARWARKNDVRSLIVVTAGYHMPRALTELGRALPDAELHPVAVIPPSLQHPGCFQDLRTLRLMAEEYTKWLISRLGFAALASRRDRPPPPQDGTREAVPLPSADKARAG